MKCIWNPEIVGLGFTVHVCVCIENIQVQGPRYGIGGKNPKVDTGKMKANFPFDLGSDGISLLLLQYIFLWDNTTATKGRKEGRSKKFS